MKVWANSIDWSASLDGDTIVWGTEMMGLDGDTIVWGTMSLDGEEIELHPGIVVYVPRGVAHKAIGKLTVLTVCIPRGVLHDVHELE